MPKMAMSSTERSKQWRLANPERWKEHQRAYRMRQPVICRGCERAIPLNRRASGRIYCSDGCGANAARLKLKQFRLRRKDTLHQLKMALGCSRCGYRKSGAALDFHHIEKNKERRLTTNGWLTPAQMQEIEKCILLCSNCHREEHEDQKIEENGDVYE